MDQLCLTQHFLLNRLRNDATSFYGHIEAFQTIQNLLKSTYEHGESNSALIIGSSRSGKTTLLSSILSTLYADDAFLRNSLIVHLDGYLDTDDGIALKTATTQMKLDNAVNGKVFGSYAENLSFLLNCLESGNKDQSKSVIFILEHFDLFCGHPKQTLLYNLFDIVQSAQAPICVLGLTCRFDVLELLEKRVKSRFSHRQITLFPADVPFEERLELYKDLLMLPNSNEIEKLVLESSNRPDYPMRFFDAEPYLGMFENDWLNSWNNKVKCLFDDSKVRSCLEIMYMFNVDLEVPKQIFCVLVARLNDNDHSFIRPEDMVRLCTEQTSDHKLQLYSEISVLEVCLLIAIKHHAEIYDRDPFNFEMILTRYRKFENSSPSRMGNVERDIALKSFEHLNMLEIFVPINAAAAKVQKELQLHRLLLTNGQIKKIVTSYPHLPTDITQWALMSLV